MSIQSVQSDLFVFDLDYTLLNADSSTLWCDYLVRQGLIADPAAFLRHEEELMDLYAAGRMQVQDYIAFTAQATARFTKAELDDLCASYVRSSLSRHVFADGYELVQQLQREHRPLLIISASAAYIVRQAASLLFGLSSEQVIAVEQQVRIREDGRICYSPEIAGIPPFQQGKVTCLKAWQEAHGLEQAKIHFWTDSINDLPLCLYADEVCAVNPAPAFARIARTHGFALEQWQAVRKAA